ncbi:MobF family relaxase [Nocardia sp. CA-107356]|uniref:MobF family relaxase n=1 Tax=Nocardia sp. CA-107356 TaxID=3239972 RepID=UPI003D932F96
MVTATLHKITAGDGYEYYTRHVAAHDGSRGREPLSDYYSAHGESPGRWLGTGLHGLTVFYRDRRLKCSRVKAGDIVTETQMKALFGEGRHPQADAIEDTIVAHELGRGAKRKDAKRATTQASRLGSPFRIYSGATEFRRRCALAYSDYNIGLGLDEYAAIPDEERARLRTAVARTMFSEQIGRPPLDVRELSGWVARASRQRTTAVAGFDWTFSPVKSVSTLWALAPRHISEKIEAAHHAAVQDAIAYLEANAANTRLGRNGVRQVDVDGLIAATFDHRDSRSGKNQGQGDPDLHTHVVVANRVRTRDGGLWRTLDGTMFYRAAVCASEIYNTRLEMHLETMLGLHFAERSGTDPAKRPIREIIGIDPRLNEFWSSRDAAITARLGELTIQFQQELGREPTAEEMYRLMQKATLDTRGAKHPLRSLAEQRAIWRQQAIAVLGGHTQLAAMLSTALRQRSVHRAVVDDTWIARCADRVIATVSAERSIWRRTHVRSEVERLVRGKIHPHQWAQVTRAVTDAALAPSRSLARGDPDIRAEPGLRSAPTIFRRADGTSVYNAADSQLYTSPKVLDIEARLIEMARETGARTVPIAVVKAAADAYNRDPDNRDKQLNEGQIATIASFATSGARIQICNAPAGTGKTSTMKVLVRAWIATGGTVLGLAPTARSVRVLGDDIETRVATVDKLLDVLAKHTPTRQRLLQDTGTLPPSLPQWVLDIDADTLVVVDEHIQISDADRLRMLIFLRSRGATVRMIGDDQQLSAIESGGAVMDMIDAAGDLTQTLTHVVRFADLAEGSASLRVREGDPAGLGFYLDRGRVHVGSPAAVVEGTFAGWLADYTAGRDTIMLAPTHAIVTELNQLARENRLTRAGGVRGLEVDLADEQRASVGDTIRTGLNNPRIRLGADDYVRNGYQWVVTAVHADGSITAARLMRGRQLGGRVRLPGDYVAAHVRLGWAATINAVQGITVGTCHTALTGHESREQLYVALTRGWLANHVYVTTAIDGSEQSFWTELALLPRTAVDVLIRILSRIGGQRSAHTELGNALDPWLRLAHAADIFLDALGLATEHTLGEEAMTQLDADVEQILPSLTSNPGYPVLRQNLATLALRGRDPIAALSTAIGARELDTADNIAAVLDWRLDVSGSHSATPGPLPWLPGIPTGIDTDSGFGEFLSARARIITELAAAIINQAREFTPSTAPVWARPLVGTDPGLLAEIAVWRAACQVDTQDLRPCGPSRFTAAERRYHQHLAARVTEAIGDVNLAVNTWAPLAKRIDVRITQDAFWPVLADRLETADRAGIDVETMLTTAAALRPLPDELPAAALWSRLPLDPSALDSTAAGAASARLAPQWAPVLRAVLGDEAAERVMADPAWTKVVAAIERADPTQWTPSELLELASELLLGGRTDRSDLLRPDQFAIALAWRIDAIIHNVPTYPDPPPPDEPPDLDDTGHPDDVPPAPGDLATDLPPDVEHSMTEDAHTIPDHNPPTTGPEPEPAPAHSAAPDNYTPAPDSADLSGAEHLSDDIVVVTGLFRSGGIGFSQAIARLTNQASDEQLRMMGRVEATLRAYAFPIARAKLEWAAQQHPEHAELIRACIPDTDPGVYRPPAYRRDDHAPRDSRRWVDPRRRRPPQPGRNDRLDEHDQYLDQRPHQYLIDAAAEHEEYVDAAAEPTADPRSRYSTVSAEYRDYDAPVRGPWDLPCVGCGLERPTIDRPAIDQHTRGSECDDGLCSDCRTEGLPGIPVHDPARYLRARCAFVADTRSAADAIAFLRRDYRRMRSRAGRRIIADLITDHGLDIAAAAPDAPKALTDSELAQRIGDVHQQIALADSLDAALHGPAAHNAVPDDRGSDTAAADAVTKALAAVAAVDDLNNEIQAIGRQAARRRAEVAGARMALDSLTMRTEELTREPNSAPRVLEQLEALTRQTASARADLAAANAALAAADARKRELITDRDLARRAAQDAHHNAEMLAGPPAGWDLVLTGAHRTDIRSSPTQSVPSNPKAASQSDTTHARRELGALQAEQRRREQLTPQQRAIEDPHRQALAPSATAPDPVERAAEAPGQDLGL